MRKRPFGRTGDVVSAIGFGAMPLSLDYRPPEEVAIELLHRVLERGVTFFDTADTYCIDEHDRHHNERLIAKAIATHGDDHVLVATKGGTRRVGGGWQIDGSPERLYRAICESQEALGGERPIDLWQHHWPDQKYAVGKAMEVAARAVEEGLVKHVGVSNYSVEQIREARTVVPVVSVQNHYNLWERDPAQERVLAYCEAEDLVYLPWRPMGGRGLAQRLERVDILARLAREKEISAHRLMLAWHLARSPAILPIPGSTRVDHALDCFDAERVTLTAAEMAEIDAIPDADLPRDEPWVEPKPYPG